MRGKNEEDFCIMCLDVSSVTLKLKLLSSDTYSYLGPFIQHMGSKGVSQVAQL